jgi:hypothetical protein
VNTSVARTEHSFHIAMGENRLRGERFTLYFPRNDGEEVSKPAAELIDG